MRKLNYKAAKAILAKLPNPPKNLIEYRALIKSGTLPDTLPLRPQVAYKGKGWVDTKTYFGFKFWSYDVLKKRVNEDAINSIKDYHIWYRQHKFAPSSPNLFYKEWDSWSVFFNNNKKSAGRKGMFSLEQAQRFLQTLENPPTTSTHYCALMRERKLHRRMPSRPHEVYQITWGEFLGTNRVRQSSLMDYQQAKQTLLSMDINIDSHKDYITLYRSRKLPKGMPCDPSQAYKGKGWVDWYEYLNNSRKQNT